jgi:hypothetical protein
MYPGTQGLFNNPGLPIDWAAIGQTPGTADNTPAAPGDTPTTPVGIFSFQNVNPGNYILKLSRSGFIPRFAKITVPSTGSLLVGHREIVGGDVTSSCLIDISALSAIIPKLSSSYDIDPNYEAKYDLNGDRNINLADYNLILEYQGFSFEAYNDTMDWILEY